MTEEARFLEKIGSTNLGPTGLNQTQNEVFCQFIESRSFIFLAYYDSLRQCLISRRDKTHEKKFCTQIWVKRIKVVPQIRFFAISSSLVDQFSFKFHRMIAWKNVYLLVLLKKMAVRILARGA